MSRSRDDALRRLDAVLHETDVDVELLLVGGAVLSVVFVHDPETRRPRRLFGDPLELERAAATVADDVALPPDWLSASVRELLGSRTTSFVWQGARLTVFSPTPDYALALKCAELAYGPEDGARAVEADLRYLARLLELSRAHDVLTEVGRYFTPRQLGPDTERRLSGLLA